jgi:hypothetical protein
MDNIEKSGTRPGQYVGYCDGAWRIWRDKTSGRWFAVKQAGSGFKTAATLKEIDAYLAAKNERGGVK